MTVSRRSFLAAAAGGAALALAGCAGPARRPGNALAFVVGAHDNAVAPSVIAPLDGLVDAAIDRDTACTVVLADGAPRVIVTVPLRITAANDLTVQRDRAALHARLRRAVDSARAMSPEVDQLAALVLAARSVAEFPGTKEIVVLDSGLQTTGGLRFQDYDGALLDAVPEEVAEHLGRTHQLPALAGVRVLLVGIGDTAGPQAALPEPARQALIGIWSAVVRRAGGEPVVSQVPLPARSLGELPKVSPVPVRRPPPPGVPLSTVTPLGDGTIGFLPDSATFRDLPQARSVVAPFVAQLLSTGGRARLTGTTSSAGTERGRRETSGARAAAVADLMIAGGVPATRIESRGVGTDFPGFIPDRDVDGGLDPVRAAKNRKVIVELLPAS